MRHLLALGLVIIILVVFNLFYSGTKPLYDTYQDYFNSHYKIFSLNIPKNLNFANEFVPIKDFYVRESLDRELMINTYWQSHTLLMHKRANRWFPLIEPILKRYGIPDDFKYVALVESGLSNAISPAGASGYWQLIESTARVYDLEVNEEVDERFHALKSTEAACKYFKDAYKKFNNWTLAAASYNLGMAGIEKQLDKQKVRNYYDLALNEETGRYVFRILAVKEIISRPKSYGFILRKKDLYPTIPTKKVKVTASIGDLATWSINQGINYRILKYFNPWLRQNRLTIKEGKAYEIEIPKDLSRVYEFIEEPEPDSTHPAPSASVMDSVKTFVPRPSDTLNKKN